MALREQLRRRGKDNRWVVGSLASLLVILSLIYYFIQRSRDIPSQLVTDRVLIFVLWYINLVLILTVGFVLLRNVVKLLVERRHRILGTQLKTKLVATYIGLSLLPVLLLFVYGSGMLRGWIDIWFDEPAVREIFDQGYAVAEELNLQIERTHVRDARRVLGQIADIDLQNPAQRPMLTRRLQALLDELQLDYLGVYEETDFVHAMINPQSGLRDLPEPGERVLTEALREGDASKVEVPAGAQGRLIMNLVAGEAGREGRRPVVVAGTLLDPLLATQSEQVILAYQGYRQLALRKGDIGATYILSFLMVTMVILLATSWVGLYLARRVTGPIQALAEGTRRIADGELDYRVEVPADDELEVLVDSFNSMTSELQRNKELLEQGNEELVAANQRLAEERAVIAAVLQNVAAGVISVDPQGRVLTCNGAALKMLQQEGEQFVGKPILGVWNDSERQKLARLLGEDPGPGGRLNRGVRMILGGEWKTFEASVTTMRDREGEISGRVMVLEDLTELLNAQQTAAWTEAARRIAHEIKNPLTPIRLAAERLLRKHSQGDPELGEALEEGAEIIVREVRTMQGMVDEFSRFARMPRPQPAEVDLGKLLDETLRLYEGVKPGVEVTGEIAEGSEVAWVDGEQLKRVLINLLDNALEAMDSPGTVEITVEKRNGLLRIDVADSGPGIPVEAKDKLFLPHFSTKRRGTGLGLSIVHRIVADHHGTIRVEENEPRGTVFTIELPQA